MLRGDLGSSQGALFVGPTGQLGLRRQATRQDLDLSGLRARQQPLREEQVRLDERVRRQVVDRERHGPVRAPAHDAVQGAVPPGADLLRRRAGRQRDHGADAPQGHVPAATHQLPGEALTRIGPALCGAGGAPAVGEGRRLVAQGLEGLDTHRRAAGRRIVVGRPVVAGGTLLGRDRRPR